MSVFGSTVDSNEKQVLQRTMAEIVAIPEVSAALLFWNSCLHMHKFKEQTHQALLLAKKHLSYTAPQHYKQPVMICGHLCNHQYLILPNTYYARHRLSNISISTITFSLPSKKNASVCTPGIKMFLNFSWQWLTEQQACGKAAHSAFLRGRFSVVEVQRPHFTSSQLKDSGVWQSLLYCYVLICEQSGGLRCVCHPSP